MFGSRGRRKNAREAAVKSGGQLIGERDCQHVMMQPLLGGFDPRLEPVALPTLRPDQHHPGRLHEQDPQITIAALRHFTEDGAVSGRDLPGHQSKPSGEVAALENTSSVPGRTIHKVRD